MPKIQFKDGNLTSDSYVKATGEYTCPSGTVTRFTMDWPEGVNMNGALNLQNLQCSCCGVTASFPTGEHYVKDGALVHEYPAPA